MKATILYKTDACHSYASQEIIGIYTNQLIYKRTISKLIRKNILDNKEDFEQEEISDYIKWNIEFFFEKGQTQGLSGFELNTETIELNSPL